MTYEEAVAFKESIPYQAMQDGKFAKYVLVLPLNKSDRQRFLTEYGNFLENI